MNMIKLSLEKHLEQKEARCNFCGEQKKCIQGSVPLYGIVYKTDHQRVIDDWEFSFFGHKKIIKGDWYYRDVIVSQDIKPLDNADICHDCIKQFYNLIK